MKTRFLSILSDWVSGSRMIRMTIVRALDEGKGGEFETVRSVSEPLSAVPCASFVVHIVHITLDLS